MKNKWIVPAIIIAVGLFLLGQRIEQGIVRSKEAVRTVSVKGLSEREVPADKVIWPLVYKELGNDLGTIYRTINTKNTIVINFLKANDIRRRNFYCGSRNRRYAGRTVWKPKCPVSL